jgi:hypothetical protein
MAPFFISGAQAGHREFKEDLTTKVGSDEIRQERGELQAKKMAH